MFMGSLITVILFFYIVHYLYVANQMTQSLASEIDFKGSSLKLPDYPQTSAILNSRYGIGGVCTATFANLGSNALRSNRLLNR